jgi:tetratricopeptide (TPR) repeat protein
MGEAYMELGLTSDALEAFKRAIQLKPDFGKAYYNLGKSYLTSGNRNAALEQYNILQTLDPDWAEKLDGLINP